MNDQTAIDTGLYFVGEAIADQRPDPQNPRCMHVSLGGSMYFGSMGAAKAITRDTLDGMRSFYVGPISKDYFGDIFVSEFTNTGVGMEYARRSEFISMIAVVSEDNKGGNKYSFYGRNQPNTTEHLRLSDLPDRFSEKNRMFCFGSVATTLSPSGLTLKQFAELQRKKDSIILYDPNTRPSVIPDVDLYRAALESWVGNASLVKASEEDVAFTYSDLGQDGVAQRWLGLGAKAVFITHGVRGCSVFGGDGHRAYVPGHIHDGIKRTVGAGDNFNAGILLGLAKRNLVTETAISALKGEDWTEIAAGANTTSFNHLLGLNDLKA